MLVTMTIACEGDDAITAAALSAVSAVFRSIGRVWICLDRDFHVVHASPLLQRVTGVLPFDIVGQPIGDFLGPELFRAGGTLRGLLEKGEVREGWQAAI